MQIDVRFRIQGGVITTAQALEGGLTRRQIEGRLTRGEWTPERRGVYRLSAYPRTWENRVLAQVLGRRAVVSHRAATVLFGIDVFTEPVPEITIPSGARVATGAIVHWTRLWDLRDEVKRRGMPCTGIERTLVDCASVEPVAVVERLCEAAILRNLTTWSELELSRDAHSRSGRTGGAAMSSLLDARRGMPTVARSDFSLLVANLLIAAGIPAPVREHRVSTRHGEHILALDLAWPEYRKALELDGLTWHFAREDIERDKRKRNRVKALGWSIQEITWSMFTDQPDDLVSLARAFLRS